jgi:class 3 adenylate cyclase/MFS family permease
MRRLRALDRALLLTIVPLWALCVTLHGVRAFEDRVGWLPVQVAPGAYPIVSGLMPNAETGDLAVGDVLRRVGETDLAGAGRVGFWTRTWAALDETLVAEFTVERAGVMRTSHVPVLRVGYPLGMLPLIGFAGLVAIAVLLRARSRREARAFFLLGMAPSLNWAVFFGPVPWQTALSLGVAFVSSAAIPVCALYALLIFPGDVAPRSRGARLWPLLGVALGPAVSSWLLGWPFSSPVGFALVMAINAATALGALAILAHHFARTGRRGRRQLKWVLYGFYVGLVPVVAGALVTRGSPELTSAYEIGVMFMALIPLCVLIAIVRDDFLDIDRLITETTAYSAAIAMLAALAPAVPAAARVAGDQLGIEAGAAQVFLILALGGGALAARSRIHPWLDSVLFRGRAELERSLAELRDELVDPSEPGKVLKLVGERLEQLLEPEGCVVYARTGGVFGPVVALGASVPPAFDADGGLAELLQKQGGAVTARDWRRWVRDGALSASEAAILETLAPEVALPVLGDRLLLAVVCLGPKRSGDIYTARETAALTAVAERAAQRLIRFGDAEIIARSRELQSQLARYVPGAIERELSAGAEPAPGEREVSILFVDIRGYTSFSERRGAAEIFATVSQYTEAVSSVVLRHGGNVVEFHGDGVMCVFGAPSNLPAKERAAVAAGRDIVHAVGALEVAGARLSVGVGIATGPAYVGNIRSTDRVIWGAIGNTTNLAARIQGLTRELEASIAICGLTCERAGETTDGFRDCGELDIRGRSELQRIHALPL